MNLRPNHLIKTASGRYGPGAVLHGVEIFKIDGRRERTVGSGKEG